MQRRLIPNVPDIKYDGNNAEFFITLLEAMLKSLGESCGTAKLAALSGEGNRFIWTDGAWVFGNELAQSLSETPFETEKRVLSALGWQAEYVAVDRGEGGRFLNTDRAQIRRDFVSAIDRGFPVLIRYREHADCDLNVVFGYEDGGRKIIGYDYNKGFQAGTAQPSGAAAPAAWADWEDNLAGYILPKSKGEAPSERDAALSAFRFISGHARNTAGIRGKKAGFAAWESFLRHLEHDDFSRLPLRAADAPAVCGVANSVEHRFYVYCDALCQIDARKIPLPYYRKLAEAFPEWKGTLKTAVEALDACASYGGFLLSEGFTFDEAGFEKFRSLTARKILADAGREAMRKDMLAVEQFEKILQTA